MKTLGVAIIVALSSCIATVRSGPSFAYCESFASPNYECNQRYIWVEGYYSGYVWVEGHYVPRRNYYRDHRRY